jgi:hypothetical protein
MDFHSNPERRRLLDIYLSIGGFFHLPYISLPSPLIKNIWGYRYFSMGVYIGKYTTFPPADVVWGENIRTGMRKRGKCEN